GWETSPNGTTWTSVGSGTSFAPGVTNAPGIFLRSVANFTDATAHLQHVPSETVHYVLDGTAGGVPGHTITGVGGIDIIFGDAGDGTVTPGADDDFVSGGGGNDTLVATVGDGNDSYDGGAGTDTYALSGTTAA